MAGDRGKTSIAAPPNEAGGIEVSIVIPCLNEERTLGDCIALAQSSLDRLGVHGEVVVADNGSADGSAAVAERLGARVVHVPVRGYGAALAAGIDAARGEYVIMGDADGSYDFGRLEQFVQRLRVGADLVIGNRFAGGIDPGAMPRLHRHVGNPLLTLIGRKLFGSATGDIYCGLRAFRRDVLDRLDLRSVGMEYAIEMVVKATLNGLRVEETPIRLRPDGREQPPHLRTWRDGWRSLRLLLLYSPRWLFLYPGIAISVVGLLLMAWLLPAQRRIGGATLDIHTFFYASTMVAIGFQALMFAVLANSFAVAEGLLPEQARFRAPVRWINLDTGFAAGIVLIVVGLGTAVAALLVWQSASFGRFPYSHSLRYVIPGGLALVLGSEIVFGCFLLSLFGLRRR